MEVLKILLGLLLKDESLLSMGLKEFLDRPFLFVATRREEISRCCLLVEVEERRAEERAEDGGELKNVATC